jgi:hypothetical protein
MARVMQPTEKQQRAWERWVRKRPKAVREVAERFDPWSLFLLKSTGDRVVIIGFGERKDSPTTLDVAVLNDFNPEVLIDRNVFGVPPDDLEPCDPP